MTRKEVYALLDGERDYQDQRWVDGLRLKPDKEKDVAEWLIYLEFLLDKAKERVYYLDREAAKEMVRKFTAVGVRCLEVHGAAARKTSKVSDAG